MPSRVIKPDPLSASKMQSLLQSNKAYIDNDIQDIDKIKPDVMHSNNVVYILPNVSLDEGIQYLVWIKGKVYAVDENTVSIANKWRVQIATSGTATVGIDFNSKLGYSTHTYTYDADDKYLVWALSDGSSFVGYCYSLMPRTTYSAVSSGTMGSEATFTVTNAYRFRVGAEVCVTANNAEHNFGTTLSIPSNTSMIVKMYPSSAYWGDQNTNITSTTSTEIIQLDKYFPWNGRTDSDDIDDLVYSKHYRLIHIAHTAVNAPIADPVTLPIGSIIAWHKDWITQNILPEGWEECDGTTVADTKSMLYGVTKPDLNGDARFLRGSSTSGTLQVASAITANMIDSTYPYNNISNNDGSNTLGTFTKMNSPGGTASQSFLEYYTRPINMSVVWIIKTR